MQLRRWSPDYILSRLKVFERFFVRKLRNITGNVLFSSAIHGYAFAVEDFANVYADKLKVDTKSLIEGLFGDFYIHGGSVKVLFNYFSLYYP